MGGLEVQDQYCRSEIKPGQRSLSAVHRENSDSMEGTLLILIQTAFLGCPKATRVHSSDNGAPQQLISLWTAGAAHLPGELSLEAWESQPWLFPIPGTSCPQVPRWSHHQHSVDYASIPSSTSCALSPAFSHTCLGVLDLKV